MFYLRRSGNSRVYIFDKRSLLSRRNLESTPDNSSRYILRRLSNEDVALVPLTLNLFDDAFLPGSPFVCLFICSSVRPLVCLYFGLSVSVSLSIHLSFYLFVNISIYLSVSKSSNHLSLSLASYIGIPLVQR